MGPQQVLPLWVRVDLEVMAIKGYSTLPKAPELELNHQMQYSIISRTLGGSYPSVERQSAYITVPVDWADTGCMKFICKYTLHKNDVAVYFHFAVLMIFVFSDGFSVVATRFFLMIIPSFLINFEENINWWMIIQFLCNIMKQQPTIIVCHNLTFFKQRQSLISH